MRTGTAIILRHSDRLCLEAIAPNRNAAQKYVWRPAIVLLSADGLGTTEIIRRSGTSNRFRPTCAPSVRVNPAAVGILMDVARARLRPRSASKNGYECPLNYLQ